MPTAITDQMPQNPWTSETSRGSSISYLVISFLVEVYIMLPMTPIVDAAHRSMLWHEAVTDTSPASTPLQSW
jgi:hypothetical protein